MRRTCIHGLQSGGVWIRRYTVSATNIDNDMELPDLQKYKDKFSQQGFVEKIQRIAKRAGAKLVYVAFILYYLIQSNKVSLKDKAIIIGALGYLISPLDVVPDAIPIAGLGDDLTVLLYALGKVWTSVDEDMKAKAREKLSKWFDEDELHFTEDLFSENPTDTPV